MADKGFIPIQDFIGLLSIGTGILFYLLRG